MNRLPHVLVLMACVHVGGALPALVEDAAPEDVPRVHALFDLSSPDTGPFPSDYFTVADEGNNTGRRVNLPYPDCGVTCRIAKIST